MPMPQIDDPQVLARVRQAAAASGLSVDAYLRMIQNQLPGGMDAPVMPRQRPFAEGPGPGGQYGGGQGQNDQPWKQYMPGGSWSESFGTPGIGNQVNPAGGQESPAPTNINAGGPLDPQASSYGATPDPNADASIFGQIRKALTYGGISFGDRLGNAGTVLSAFADPYGRSLTPAIAKANENMSNLRDVAERKELYYADQAKKQQMAERIANNVKDTNPQLAQALLDDYTLVDDYMKGQLNIMEEQGKSDIQQGRELVIQDDKQAGDLELEEYKSGHNQEKMDLEAWRGEWNDFLEGFDLQDASTQEVYKKWYEDPDLTLNESARLASANMRGGHKALDAQYDEILKRRDELGKEGKAPKSIAQQAAELAGVEIDKNQRIANAQEVVDSGGEVAPIIEDLPGSERAEAKKKAITFDIKTNSADYLATQRAIDALDVQKEGGTFTTGAGWTGLAEMIPESNAKELGRALQSINAGGAFKMLIDVRAANESGAGVGNVTEGEYPIMTAAEEEKFDILQDPEILRDRLVQHQNVGIAFMAMAPDGSKRSLLQYIVDGLRENPTPKNIADFDKRFGSGYSKLVLSTEGEAAR